MIDILSDECINNILGHIKNSWKYSYPTGATLENAVFEGIRSFYQDAKNLGSPQTIVDVGKETQAFDIKGSKSLGHVKNIVKSANHEKNIFVNQNVPNSKSIKVRIPKSITTQVRRPKVDLKNYKGNAKKTIEDQINDYHQFAIETTNKDGYKELYSIVLLYGIDKGYKSIFLTLEKFNIPDVVSADIGTKQDGTPCAYHGLDTEGNTVFSLSSFNKGSSNFYKKFETTNGILITWLEEEKDSTIFTREDLEKDCAIKRI